MMKMNCILCRCMVQGCLRIEIGMLVDERYRKWCWLDMPFGRVAWIKVSDEKVASERNCEPVTAVGKVGTIRWEI